eukprot:81571_1
MATEQYTVNAICGHRKSTFTGIDEWKVQWDGFKGLSDEFSWEPEAYVCHLTLWKEFEQVRTNRLSNKIKKSIPPSPQITNLCAKPLLTPPPKPHTPPIVLSSSSDSEDAPIMTRKIPFHERIQKYHQPKTIVRSLFPTCKTQSNLQSNTMQKAKKRANHSNQPPCKKQRIGMQHINVSTCDNTPNIKNDNVIASSKQSNVLLGPQTPSSPDSYSDDDDDCTKNIKETTGNGHLKKVDDGATKSNTSNISIPMSLLGPKTPSSTDSDDDDNVNWTTTDSRQTKEANHITPPCKPRSDHKSHHNHRKSHHKTHHKTHHRRRSRSRHRHHHVIDPISRGSRQVMNIPKNDVFAVSIRNIPKTIAEHHLVHQLQETYGVCVIYCEPLNVDRSDPEHSGSLWCPRVQLQKLEHQEKLIKEREIMIGGQSVYISTCKQPTPPGHVVRDVNIRRSNPRDRYSRRHTHKRNHRHHHKHKNMQKKHASKSKRKIVIDLCNSDCD